MFEPGAGVIPGPIIKPHMANRYDILTNEHEFSRSVPDGVKWPHLLFDALEATKTNGSDWRWSDLLAELQKAWPDIDGQKARKLFLTKSDAGQVVIMTAGAVNECIRAGHWKVYYIDGGPHLLFYEVLGLLASGGREMAIKSKVKPA